VIAVGFPTAYWDRSNLEGCKVSRVFIQSTKDQFGSVTDLQAVFNRLDEPKQLVLVEAEDHFFAGALDQFEAAVARLR
jgi:alpha/beta superfamily hydrolase